MKFHRMAPAALAAGLLGAGLVAPAALAATSNGWNTVTVPAPAYETATGALSHTEQCRALERRFDGALASHQQASKLAEARSLRAAGGKSCNEGQMAPGIDKLKQALNDIGVSTKL